MRRAEPLEPEMAAALAAIDATLDGDPVDPEHAELAELALILRAERPAPAREVAGAIDERVAERCARPPLRRRLRPRRAWLAAPVAGLAAVALVVAIVSIGGNGGSSSGVSGAAALSATSSASAAASAPAGGAASARRAPSGAGVSRSAPSHAAAPARGNREQAPVPSPSPSGKRQVVQSAQLSLSAAPSRIDDVAQQVFDVVDAENGIVVSSHVTSTGGPDGGARFALSVPVGNLQRTVSELSQLQAAHVVSRSDDTNDITGQVGGAGRRLAEARALRRSLLRQLAAATTTEAIAGLRAQLRDADATIRRDSASLNGLHRSVANSSLTVTIQAASVPVPVASHGGGFTLRRALHDAARVLVVVAGVALIALAVLVPLGLLVALVGWVGLVVRRRRREATLDLI
ncbi:MAG TPA: DUF4349 domain-containing protein [Solirubrobacteraceae bacterium]|nr:DUF4349 domain-containing protein [Solirubrobacteraceae bacterium]